MSDLNIEEIWMQLSNVTIDDDECIMSPFYIWEAGTNKEDIWRWFNKNHTKGIHYLMYEYEGE